LGLSTRRFLYQAEKRSLGTKDVNDKLYDAKRYDFVTNKDGTTSRSTTFGNFCPKCKAPSDHVMVYGKGLFICSDCDYIFSIDDIEKDVEYFWSHKK